MSEKLSILAIGAHPDDIECGCGGTLIKFVRAGHDVYLMVLTQGNLGGDPGVRRAEQEQSMKLIGARRIFWGEYDDTHVPVDVTLISTIEDVIREVRPSFIFTHAPQDTHQDHRNISQATLSATRYTRNVLFYEVPTTVQFMPGVFVDIRDVIEDKIELLRAHASQVEKTRIEDLDVLSLARSNATFRGTQARVKYAEGFSPVRLFFEMPT